MPAPTRTPSTAAGPTAPPWGWPPTGRWSSAGDDPELLAQLRQAAAGGGSAVWLTVLGRAVARGEAAPEALHPRVATVALVLLRNEYVAHGLATVPDSVVVEIVDEVFLPLVHGRGAAAR